MSGWVVITNAPVYGCVNEERGDEEGVVSQTLSLLSDTLGDINHAEFVITCQVGL